MLTYEFKFSSFWPCFIVSQNQNGKRPHSTYRTDIYFRYVHYFACFDFYGASFIENQNQNGKMCVLSLGKNQKQKQEEEENSHFVVFIFTILIEIQIKMEAPIFTRDLDQNGKNQNGGLYFDFDRR